MSDDNDFLLTVLRWSRGYPWRFLSRDTEIVVFAIGDGNLLRIPKHVEDPTAHAQLVEGFPRFSRNKREPLGVRKEVAEELLSSRLLHRLERDGEFVEGEKVRGGWREAGLNGDVADFYCMEM